MTKFRLSFYLCFPLLAILACNAPIDRLQPAVITVERPTIGPPPTLTPISLQESEFVIVTAIVFPTDTPTPVESYTPTAEPTPIPDTATPQPALPTATLDPTLESGQTNPTATPESYPPIRLFTYYQWGNFEELNEETREANDDRPEVNDEDENAELTPTPITYQESYKGRLVLVGRGGAGVFAYYVNGERISGEIILIDIGNCSEETFSITVQSLNSEPLEQDVTVEAPCLEE